MSYPASRAIAEMVSPRSTVTVPSPPGAYAEAVAVPAEDVVRVPGWLSAEKACALMMQGLTAHYLGTSTFVLGDGRTAVVHAAAGGVGRLLVQVARRCGARTIAVVSTGHKAEIAREAGADEVLIAPGPDLADRVRELTGGVGADVVYDGVGLATFRQSMAAVRPRGTLVLFGQASGAVPPFDTLEIAERSIFLTRPRLRPHVDTRHQLARRSGELFGWVGAGAVDVRVDRVLPLAEAAAAHAYLESGQTTGKVLLRPGGAPARDVDGVTEPDAMFA